MKAHLNRMFGKRDACKELALIFLEIAKEGYKIDEVMVGAVLEQYRQDKLDIMHRYEEHLGASVGEDEYKRAYREMIEDDRSRYGQVLTFVSLLELLKQRTIDAEQKKRYGDIKISLINGGNNGESGN